MVTSYSRFSSSLHFFTLDRYCFCYFWFCYGVVGCFFCFCITMIHESNPQPFFQYCSVGFLSCEVSKLIYTRELSVFHQVSYIKLKQMS